MRRRKESRGEQVLPVEDPPLLVCGVPEEVGGDRAGLPCPHYPREPLEGVGVEGAGLVLPAGAEADRLTRSQ